MHIFITGASGSGTTTLGVALAQELHAEHIDTDYFYWLPTKPPYQDKRSKPQRLENILAAMHGYERTVTSGSVMGWGKALENKFDLIVFLYLDTEIRLARLRKRELAELGTVDEAFIDWASQYNEESFEGRSLKRHKSWLQERRCPVIEVTGDKSVAERINVVKDYLSDY